MKAHVANLFAALAGAACIAAPFAIGLRLDLWLLGTV